MIGKEDSYETDKIWFLVVHVHVIKYKEYVEQSDML